MPFISCSFMPQNDTLSMPSDNILCANNFIICSNQRYHNADANDL